MARRVGRSIVAALLLASPACAGDLLTVETADGPLLLQAEVADGAEWCLEWQHSVTGGDVADCFVNDDSRMVLERSYLHDFAAGLGTVEGRGTMRSAPDGGYWIENMHEAIANNTLPLRVGRPSVRHRLTVAGDVYDLSSMAAGERVVLRLIPGT